MLTLLPSNESSTWTRPALVVNRIRLPSLLNFITWGSESSVPTEKVAKGSYGHNSKLEELNTKAQQHIQSQLPFQIFEYHTSLFDHQRQQQIPCPGHHMKLQASFAHAVRPEKTWHDFASHQQKIVIQLMPTNAQWSLLIQIVGCLGHRQDSKVIRGLENTVKIGYLI